MVTAPQTELKERLERRDVLALGLEAGRVRQSDKVGFLEDEAVLLAMEEHHGERESPRLVHLLGGDAGQIRKRYPGVWVHGLGEGDLDSLSYFSGELGQPPLPAPQPDKPVVACFTYTPDFSAESLLQRLEFLRALPRLVSVVPLPALPGDRVPVRGVTTEGTDDAAVLAVTRIVLPRVHVRSSWAAFGWKVAQVGLAFGADELAGWGAEEQQAYSSRTRPASVVDRQEVLLGIKEAMFEAVEVGRCDWGF